MNRLVNEMREENETREEEVKKIGRFVHCLNSGESFS
jgi:hypothetical protein